MSNEIVIVLAALRMIKCWFDDFKSADTNYIFFHSFIKKFLDTIILVIKWHDTKFLFALYPMGPYVC